MHLGRIRDIAGTFHQESNVKQLEYAVKKLVSYILQMISNWCKTLVD